MRNLDEKGRLWAEVDLDALAFNFEQCRAHAGGARVMAVLKGDAYGHGAVKCARALERAGAGYFVVGTPEEALQLRKAGVQTPLLLLGIVPDCMAVPMIENNVELAVSGLDMARDLARLARGRTAKVHVQLDTGMSRFGVSTRGGVEQAGGEVAAIAALPGIELRGFYTHLCAADDPAEDEFTRRQIELFRRTAGYVRGRGVEIPLCHCANSAALLRFPEARFDMVRAGIVLYGLMPEPWMEGICELRRVLSMRARVMQVKTIGAGVSVGYGRRWKAPAPTQIVTIGAGYSDGIPRRMAGEVQMLLRGRRIRQVGRLCMDLCMLDATGIPCECGDIVTVLGRDGEDQITAEELAGGRTVPDEPLANISKRVPRIYYRGGAAVARTEYLPQGR